MAGWWYSGNWKYRKSITIDHTKVAGDLTYFPVLISLSSDSDLASNALSTGYDILFTSADGITKLNHERVRYTTATGELIAWVRIPSLSSSVDTVIYMYFGNPDATDQQNITGTWDDGGSNYYSGVWHLEESGNGTAGEYKDSTANANNGQGGSGIIGGSATPTRATGKVGYGQSFARVNTQFISIPDATSMRLTGNFTLEAWGYANSFLAGWQYASLIGRQYGAGTDDSYELGVGNDITTRSWPYLWVQGGTDFQNDSEVNSGTWYHYVITVGGSNCFFYINGSQTADYGSGLTTLTDANPTLFGAQENNATTTPTADTLWDGIIDEVRISKTQRSGAWVTTEYRNQNSPGTFYSIESWVEEYPHRGLILFQDPTTL